MKRTYPTGKRKSITPSVVTKQDIHQLSAKIDRNQKALDQLDGVSKKLDDVSAKIDRNQKALDQIDDVARILRDNEQNLKDLGGLKHRLDTLDTIMVSVDKIAGSIQIYRQEQVLNSDKLSKHDDRLEKIETHLNLPAVL
ncbi:hypothetical protein HY086_06620 [Candidatus Gottesmanbacteria bacterium]|nr:hypothetical protein [Candidatus Gottesmanbacteria bacterium]